MNKVRRALVFADHSQFYIQDIDGQMAAEADEGYDWPEAWSEEAVEVYRIGLDGPCSIAIGTARSDHVETTLRVHGGEPPLVEAEHIVEADLTVPSGVVHVLGCMELPGPWATAHVRSYLSGHVHLYADTGRTRAQGRHSRTSSPAGRCDRRGRSRAFRVTAPD